MSTNLAAAIGSAFRAILAIPKAEADDEVQTAASETLGTLQPNEVRELSDCLNLLHLQVNSARETIDYDEDLRKWTAVFADESTTITIDPFPVDDSVVSAKHSQIIQEATRLTPSATIFSNIYVTVKDKSGVESKWNISGRREVNNPWSRDNLGIYWLEGGNDSERTTLFQNFTDKHPALHSAINRPNGLLDTLWKHLDTDLKETSKGG